MEHQLRNNSFLKSEKVENLQKFKGFILTGSVVMATNLKVYFEAKFLLYKERYFATTRFLGAIKLGRLFTLHLYLSELKG